MFIQRLLSIDSHGILVSACTGSSQATATTTSSAAAKTTTATGICNGVAAWQTGVVYTAGDKVTYRSVTSTEVYLSRN